MDIQIVIPFTEISVTHAFNLSSLFSLSNYTIINEKTESLFPHLNPNSWYKDSTITI